MKQIDKELLKNIYKDIKSNNRVTEIELSDKYLVSERTIRRYIKMLKDKGKVQLIGYGKIRYWLVLK